MWFVEFITAFILLSINVHHSTADGNCDDIKYISINDARRSTAFDVRNTSHVHNLLCDRSVIKDDLWYRFSNDVGGELATTPPEYYHCGTYYPIWMNGSHPTNEEGKVTRRACIKMVHRFPINCGKSYNIQVLNCSGYYIYQLKNPIHCNAAYCAGSKKPNCTNVEQDTICPANLPPYFTMPHKTFYAIENMPLRLEILAKDPEAQLLTFTLPNRTIQSASIGKRNGELTLVTNKSGSVNVSIEDEVGSQIILTLQIITKRCPCRNGGKCLWEMLPAYPVHSPSLTACICITPYTGARCESIPQAACEENLPCFPGLKCTVTEVGFVCEKCPDMFEGDGRICKPNPIIAKFSITAELAILDGIVWKDDLYNKTSLYYKKTTAELTIQIKLVYRGVKEFVYIVVTGYRQGSVIVEFNLVFSKELHDPLDRLEKCTKKNGKLGNMVVERLKETDHHSESTSDKKIFGIEKSIFIVVVVVVSMLAITAVVAVALLIRKKKLTILLRWSDDGDSVCPSAVGSSSSVRKPRNQVVDIASVDNKVFLPLQ